MVDYMYVAFSIASIIIAGMFMLLAVGQGPDDSQQARTVQRPREETAADTSVSVDVDLSLPDGVTITDVPGPQEGPLTLKEQAHALVRESDDETVAAVEWWVYENIRYERANYVRGVAYTWDNKVGDCTDMAMLSKEMLSEVGIDTKLVHGFYTPPGGEKDMHDWFEVKGKAYNYEGSDLEYVGDGIW